MTTSSRSMFSKIILFLALVLQILRRNIDNVPINRRETFGASLSNCFVMLYFLSLLQLYKDSIYPRITHNARQMAFPRSVI